MSAPRWTEVLLPLLAARGWAPWFIEPRHAQEWRATERPPVAAARQASWSDRKQRHLLFDDVQ
jgi:hypothetical protein